MSTGFSGGFMPVGPGGPGSPAVPDIGGDAPEFTTHADGQPGGDPEALSDEREEYPDPEEYPLADPPTPPTPRTAKLRMPTSRSAGTTR